MTVRQTLPAFVTMCALACGLASLEAARLGAYELAFRLILLAAVADGIDGAFARRLHAVGPMGKQLDSLSDVVAFGVAPAFLFATRFAGTADPWRYGVAFAFVAAGAYRLARFHAEERSSGFSGLPITAAGMLLAATTVWPFALSPWATNAVAVVLAGFMVSTVAFPKPDHWHWTMAPAFLMATIPAAFWPHAETLALVVTAVLGAYLLWSLLNCLLDEDGPLSTAQPEDLPTSS